MAPPAKQPAGWKLEDDEGLPATIDDGPSKRKRAKKAPSPLCKPVWNSKLVAQRAHRAIDSTRLDAFFKKVAGGLPKLLLLKLLELVAPSLKDNPVFASRGEDFESFFSDVKDAVQGELYPDNVNRNGIVLAAYLGAVGLPPIETAISDGTFLEPESPIRLADREMKELSAYYTSGGVLDPVSGAVSCYCGKRAAFKTQQGFKGGKPTCYYVCGESQCRLWITTTAVPALHDLMEQLNVKRFPAFFCLEHPEQCIKIVESEGVVSARCPWFKNEGGNKEFCVTEILGSEDSFKMTSEKMMIAMDVLYA